MHVKVIHYDRRWRRVENHMDARHCPECGASIHGKHGQREHQNWHLRVDDVLDWAEQRMRMASPALGAASDPPWTAVVDGDRAALEA